MAKTGIIDAVELTQALIRCPSVTPYDVGAQDVLCEALNPLGFDAYDVTSEDVRNSFFRLGTEGPHLCFCGHTDVVPAGAEESWSHPPFAAEIHNGKLYGRGASDMKGNIACFIAALSRYLQDNTLKGSVSLLITGDEEGDAVNGTVKVLEWMAENGHTPDFALVGEPTNPEKLGQEIKIGRRGSLSGILTVTGKQGHVAYQHLADNPLPRLVRLLDKLTSYEFDQGNEYFPPTNLELTTIDTGNSAGNVIPEKTRAVFNIRFNDQWSAQTLGQKVKEILATAGEEGKYTLELLPSNAESFLTAPGPITEMIAASVEEITGSSPQITTSGGTSDARFVQAYCPVVECGLVNKTIHQVDEHAAIDDLMQMTEIYLKILEKYFA